MTPVDIACIAFVLTFLALPSLILAACLAVSVVRVARGK